MTLTSNIYLYFEFLLSLSLICRNQRPTKKFNFTVIVATYILKDLILYVLKMKKSLSFRYFYKVIKLVKSI